MGRLSVAVAAVLAVSALAGCGGSSETIIYDYDETGDAGMFEVGDRPAFQGQAKTNVLTTGVTSVVNGMSASIGEAETLTVEFQVTAPTASNSLGIYNCVATVMFTIGGVQIIRQISVVNGASISGVGTGVQVTLQDQTVVLGGLAYALGNPYSVDVVVSRGVRGSVAKLPTLYGGFFVVLASTSASIAVPQNSGVVAVQVLADTSQTNGNVNDVLAELLVNTAIVPTASWNTDSQPGMVPLIPNAYRLNIFNNGSQTVHVTVIWGVDG